MNYDDYKNIFEDKAKQNPGDLAVNIECSSFLRFGLKRSKHRYATMQIQRFAQWSLMCNGNETRLSLSLLDVIVPETSPDHGSNVESDFDNDMQTLQGAKTQDNVAALLFLET